MPSINQIFAPLLVAVLALLVATLGPSAFFLAGDAAEDSRPTLDADIDGLPFPGEITAAGARQRLIGGGTRSKWGFRVYGVGLYGDPRLCRALTQQASSGAATESALARAFGESPRARTALLRFRRAVASSDVAEALGDALVDRLGAAGSARFSSFVLGVVGGARVEPGTDLFLACRGEKMWASLAEGNGREARTLRLEGLCAAIFEVYLGDSPVSPQAKEGFRKGLAELGVG